MRGYGAHRVEYDELRETFPGQGFLRRSDVAQYLGLKDRKSVAAFLADVPAYRLNGKEYSYKLEDVALKIHQSLA